MSLRENYRLRKIAEEDLELILQWRNSDKIRRNMYGDHIINMAEHKSWFNHLGKSTDAVYLVFEFLLKPIGMVYFTDIDRKNNKCFFGFYLGEDHLPLGTGTVMGLLGTEYAFETLKIRKLCGEAFQFNTSSVKLFKRLGFFEEGLFIKHVLKKGRYEDVVSFAIFSDGWQDKRNMLENTVFVGEVT